MLLPPDASYVFRSGEGATHEPRIAVLIPALDEEEALPGVLKGLRREGVDRIVVVDNGSSDGTVRVAIEGGAEVVREPVRGYGAACLAGLRYLAPDPPDVVVFMDGDQSDDPADLPKLLDPIRSGEADMVVGVRTGDGRGGTSAVPLHARLGNGVVRMGMRLLHGLVSADLGPFRAVRYSSLRSLEMDDRDWGWTVQMQLRAHHAGLRVRERDVSHHPRYAGRSKVSGSLKGSVRAGSKMLLTLVTERLRAWRGAR